MSTLTAEKTITVYLTGVEDAGDLKMLTEHEAQEYFEDWIDNIYDPWFFGDQLYMPSRVMRSVDELLYKQEWERYRFENFSAYEVPQTLAIKALADELDWKSVDGMLRIEVEDNKYVTGLYYDPV